MSKAIQSLEHALEEFAACHRQWEELLKWLREEARDTSLLTAKNMMNLTLKHDALKEQIAQVGLLIHQAIQQYDEEVAAGLLTPEQRAEFAPLVEKLKEDRAGALEALADYRRAKAQKEEKG